MAKICTECHPGPCAAGVCRDVCGTVYYAAQNRDGRYYYKSKRICGADNAPAAFDCSNRFFGEDPLYGIVKSCYLCPSSAVINCVGDFNASGACSASCGGGTQIQTYRITTPAANGGTACPYANGFTQSQACNTERCPVDCQGAWSAFGSCSLPCGGGTQSKNFTISTPAAYGGKACPYPNGFTQSQACNTQSCPLVIASTLPCGKYTHASFLSPRRINAPPDKL
jgi:hypothetical protein